MIAAAAAAQDQAKIDAGEASTTTIATPVTAKSWSASGQTFDLRRLTAKDRARFENSVLAGKSQMPPWKGVLSSEQIDLLWQFIRANVNNR